MNDDNSDDGSRRLIERLNAVLVTSEQIIEAIERTNDIRDEHHSPDARWTIGIATISELHRDNIQLAQAISFRLQALANLVTKESLPGWIERVASNQMLTSEAVFAAAAFQPMLIRGNDVYFDKEDFLVKALELAEPQGTS